MSDCCSSSDLPNKLHLCPACVSKDRKYSEVSRRTLLHHVKAPWQTLLVEQTYYFCHSRSCDVVYFGEDDSTIVREQLRIKVGIKESDDDALICYCFGVSNLAAKADDQIKIFVVEQTKNGSCSCLTHNPSGKCCLKDFPK